MTTTSTTVLLPASRRPDAAPTPSPRAGYLAHASAVAKHLGFDEDGQHHSEAESAVSSIVMDYCNPFGRRKLLEGDVSVAPRSSYFTVSSCVEINQ